MVVRPLAGYTPAVPGLFSPSRSAIVDLLPAEPDPVRRTAAWARAVLDAGLLDIPLPGRGATARRFATLADIGSVDLDLARLVEAHVDAHSILADLDSAPDAADLDRGGLWGVWAANPPVDPLLARPDGAGGWLLRGTKPWCSGAGCCDRALVTARAATSGGDGGYRLYAVELAHPGAAPVDGTWPAAAMQGSDSRSVTFTDVPAVAIGGPDEYLTRAGFWHGAVGVAAVWWGGARGVAEALARADRRRPLNPHALAHAGAVDALLTAAAAQLSASAQEFDDDPTDKHGMARLTAARVRATVETAATTTIDRVGRALGAGPLALDAAHGRRVAGLALYLRQSHAERDLEELGRAALASGLAPWDGSA